MTARGSFLWRRMGSVRLLLLSILFATLFTASLVAALSGFAVNSLPQAIHGDLAPSPRTSVVLYGAFGAVQARADQRAVTVAMRRAFGTIRGASEQALWSDSISGLSVTGQTTTLVRAGALSRVIDHARLLAGAWPAGVAAAAVPAGLRSAVRPVRAMPIQAAAPAAAAAALHLHVGELLTLSDALTGARVRFLITGVYRALSPAAPYWAMDLIGPSGVSVQPGFTTYGPLIVAPGAFADGGLAIGGSSWLTVPDLARISAGQLDPLAGRVSAAVAYLAGSPRFGGLQASTGLPAALSGAAVKLVVARSLLVVSELELILLAVAVLTLAARMLASQREDEVAILAARGSGRGQLARLALIEALAVNVVAAGAGVALGSLLAWLGARTGPLRAAGLRFAGIPAAAWWTAGLVALLCTAAMVWPALRPLTPAAAGVRRGRRAAASAAARAGGDVALVALAVLAGWQLRQYSVLGRTGGRLGIDPVLALAPAVALAAATVIPLRLLPALARAADRLAARTSRLGVAMTSWEISRRAARQSAPTLLVVLAVGTGTLALAQHESWRRSVADQSAFAAGADVRADLTKPLPLGRSAQIARARGVTAAMPASTGLSTQDGGPVLALDARHAAATVLLRADQSAFPPAALWRLLTPARTSPAVTLPGRPAALEITASLAAGPGPPLGPAEVAVCVEDAAGVVYAVPAGPLAADGRPHALVAVLAPRRQAFYPLRLLAVSLQYTLPPVPRRRLAPAAAARLGFFRLSGLALSDLPHGAFAAPFASGQALARWSPAVHAPALSFGNAAGQPPSVRTPDLGPGWQETTFHLGDGHLGQPGLTLGPPFAPITAQLTVSASAASSEIPGIATAAFLRANHLKTGAVVRTTAGDAGVAVKIVAAVESFPTITGPQGGLIVDLTAAQSVVAAQDVRTAQPGPVLPVTQWWLATSTRSVPAGLPAGTVVLDRARLLAALQADPLAVIPQQAVRLITLAAALLAILGFSVAIAGSVRERRSQSALLAALGVGGTTQARLLCLEALALSLPAAVTGLLLGTVLAHLIVPAITLTALATAPLPTVLVEVPLLTAVALALAVAAIPVLAAAASAAWRPDPAATLRAAAAT